MYNKIKGDLDNNPEATGIFFIPRPADACVYIDGLTEKDVSYAQYSADLTEKEKLENYLACEIGKFA